jgi:hypothetical protein
MTPKQKIEPHGLDIDGGLQINGGGCGGDLCGEGYAEDLEVGGGGWAIERRRGF